MLGNFTFLDPLVDNYTQLRNTIAWWTSHNIVLLGSAWPRAAKVDLVKALVWFWIIDETLSANLVYQSDYEIGSTILSDEAMVKIMIMVMAW